MAVSRMVLVLVLVMVLVGTVQGLDLVNKRTEPVTVFVPPICQPCTCPMIYCIRAPCIQNCPCPQVPCRPGKPCVQPDCVCTLECRLRVGVVVAAGAGPVTLPVERSFFPLAFLTVEVGDVAYNARGTDLKRVTVSATVVVTGTRCGDGKTGIVALVCRTSQLSGCRRLCLVRGKRYGS